MKSRILAVMAPGASVSGCTPQDRETVCGGKSSAIEGWLLPTIKGMRRRQCWAVSGV